MTLWPRHLLLATTLQNGQQLLASTGQARSPGVVNSSCLASLSQAAVARRRVLVVRHGERVDQVFGKSWLQQCSTPDGRWHVGNPVDRNSMDFTNEISSPSPCGADTPPWEGAWCRVTAFRESQRGMDWPHLSRQVWGAPGCDPPPHQWGVGCLAGRASWQMQWTPAQVALSCGLLACPSRQPSLQASLN